MKLGWKALSVGKSELGRLGIIVVMSSTTPATQALPLLSTAIALAASEVWPPRNVQ